MTNNVRKSLFYVRPPEMMADKIVVFISEATKKACGLQHRVQHVESKLNKQSLQTQSIARWKSSRKFAIQLNYSPFDLLALACNDRERGFHRSSFLFAHRMILIFIL